MSRRPPTTLVTWVAAAGRLHGRLRHGAARVLAAMVEHGFQRTAWRRMGPIPVGLDMADKYQRDMALGGYEPLAESFFKLALRPGDTYVDIGAQLGFTAGVAAGCIGPGGRMALFEPDPAALPRLRRHLAYARGKGLPKTRLIPAACSNEPGELTLYSSPILGHSRLVADGDGLEGGELVRVPIVVAERELERLGISSVRLLKVDTEGHEIRVLAGLQKLLAGSVDFVMIEKNQYLFRDQSLDTLRMHALIARHGFVAVHESTLQLATRESLRDTGCPLENLYYARDAALLSEFCGRLIDPRGDGFAPGEIESIAQWTLAFREQDEAEADCIALAKSGDAAAALAAGRALLGRFPEAVYLRGHMAQWCLLVGDAAGAAEQLREILRRQPENREARSQLDSLENKAARP